MSDRPMGAVVDRGVVHDRWYRELFEASPVAMALADEDGLLVLVNGAYCALVGRSPDDLLGRSSREFTHPDDLAQHAQMADLMSAATRAGDQLRVEKRYLRPDGSVRWGWVSVAPVGGGAGPQWTMAVVYDTTERRVAEDALTNAAMTDVLTGLLNRRGWRDAVRRLAYGARASPLALVLLDLDHFKAYNDLHGHPAGDRLLQDFASAARRALRTEDVLARWGGEEFAIALPLCGPADAAVVLAELAELVPDGQTFSAGVTSLRLAESVADCWDRADALLYTAKHNGRNQIVTDAD